MKRGQKQLKLNKSKIEEELQRSNHHGEWDQEDKQVSHEGALCSEVFEIFLYVNFFATFHVALI